jgi:hypothetical protein
VNVECKDTQTSVWSSQYNIKAIKLSEAYTNKMKVIARLKHKNHISVTAVEVSFHEMRDKSYLCSVCGIGMK